MARAKQTKVVGRGLFGKFIRERREHLGMTLLDVAARLGYKWGNFIGMIETGAAQFPLDKWEQYAEVMEVPKHEFLRKVLEELHPRMLSYLEFRDPFSDQRRFTIDVLLSEKQEREGEIKLMQNELESARKSLIIIQKLKAVLNEHEDTVGALEEDEQGNAELRAKRKRERQEAIAALEEEKKYNTELRAKRKKGAAVIL